MDFDKLPDILNRLQSKFKSVMVRLPMLAGNEAVNFVLDNFKKQGFQGAVFEPWKKRKNPNKWGMAPPRNGRSTLVDTGRLRRSWRVTRVTGDTAYIGSDVPYAKANNEGSQLGLIQTVKGFTRNNGQEVKEHTRKINQKLPRRRMIGQSPYLNSRVARVINVELLKAMREFQ